MPLQLSKNLDLRRQSTYHSYEGNDVKVLNEHHFKIDALKKSTIKTHSQNAYIIIKYFENYIIE